MKSTLNLKDDPFNYFLQKEKGFPLSLKDLLLDLSLELQKGLIFKLKTSYIEVKNRQLPKLKLDLKAKKTSCKLKFIGKTGDTIMNLSTPIKTLGKTTFNLTFPSNFKSIKGWRLQLENTQGTSITADNKRKLGFSTKISSLLSGINAKIGVSYGFEDWKPGMTIGLEMA